MPIPVLLGWLLNRTEVSWLVFSMSLLHDFFGALFHFQQTKYLESNYTWGGLLSALLLVRPIAIYNEQISCNAYRPDYLQSELNSQSEAEVKGFHQWNYPMSLALGPYENWRGYINGTTPTPSYWANVGYNTLRLMGRWMRGVHTAHLAVSHISSNYILSHDSSL